MTPFAVMCMCIVDSFSQFSEDMPMIQRVNQAVSERGYAEKSINSKGMLTNMAC